MRHTVIAIRAASEHNLRSIDLDLPRDALVVVTGVSGSGKSSLAFDTLCREGQRRYLESFSSYARQFLARLRRPAVGHIEGLSPAIAVDQRTVVRSPRSTVGTLTELYDYLRLVFARLGTPPPSPDGGGDLKLERRLFSFNAPEGACPRCNGLGVEDRIDPALVVADPARTLRQGALVPTTPNGYIVYSQVTVDSLDRVCRAHGFDVDTPWRALTDEQREVIWRGSDRVRIPYGKHTLESRLRWTGITARPREEGFYKGLLTVMEQTLARDRNKNILRFVRSMRCGACGGRRLRPEALAVRFHERDIAALAAMSVSELRGWFESQRFGPAEAPVAEPVRADILARCRLLEELGLGYLTLDRESTTLSGGEAQRLRLATQAGSGLRGILYVLDEPSAGLHPRDTQRLLALLERLRDLGNTVVVVEHDPLAMRAADWIVDLGPGAGSAGGELLFSGPLAELLADAKRPLIHANAVERSHTRAFLTGEERIELPAKRRAAEHGWIRMEGLRARNLKDIAVAFPIGAFSVVTGVSGAGKSTLVEQLIEHVGGPGGAGDSAGEGREGGAADERRAAREVRAATGIAKVVVVDQSPIGRTPRSNPATYTGLFDSVRDLFASLPESRERGFGKGRFSFNVAGGRCETCGGAGCQDVGMHFLGAVEVPCEACGGRRFNDETLAVLYRGKSIHDVLEMPIEQACEFFADLPAVARGLEAMRALGLGYLTLGQPSTTLSGGEAQRVKLATELGRPASSAGATLYVLDEPTVGLHAADVKVLLRALQQLVERGDTVVAVEHDPDVVKVADWVVDLGPGSGAEGGRVVVAGTPEQVAACEASFTGAALREALGMSGAASGAASSPAEVRGVEGAAAADEPIRLRGVATHNLKDLDVEIPFGKLTVVTGVSGSGKSSLAFDTLVAEGQNRFTDSFSTYARRFVEKAGKPELASATGLTPAVAIRQRIASTNPRSTVGTMTEAYDLLRLLFARVGVAHCPSCGVEVSGAGGRCPRCDGVAVDTARLRRASAFSFNHEQGACPDCGGLGLVARCDPEKLVTNPEAPLLAGALDGTKTGRFYGDPHGQHTAILTAVGEALGIDFAQPWSRLDANARQVAMFGAGERAFEFRWQFKETSRETRADYRKPWLGFARYVDEEYTRKHADARGAELEPLMSERVCQLCGGERLRADSRAVRVAGATLGALVAQSVDALSATVRGWDSSEALPAAQRRVSAELREELQRKLGHLSDAGLGYLSLDRRASTLSGGEAQRVRLAAGLGSGLSGITYVLDEPTTGLHARDTARLIALMRSLRDRGNTVVVVEHDADVIRAADHVIDLGPGGGPAGGRIVAQGPVEAICAAAESRTGAQLRMRQAPPKAAASEPARKRPLAHGVTVRGARANTLQRIDVAIPSGGLVAVTGVSGSGKSSLVFDVIGATASAGRPVGCEGIEGLDAFARVVAVDARPLGSGGGGAATVATWLGVYDGVRARFASTEVARARGWKKNFFSLAAKGGRCERCEGRGSIRVRMDFLPDVEVPCEECGGRRFRAEVLECRWKGRDVAEVLEMSAAEAAEHFAGEAEIAEPLRRLDAIGIGYLRVGQGLGQLSGGEAQRLKVISEIGAPAKGRNLYLLDEPTAGLHFDDVDRLVASLERLIAAGHTVVVVEHNLDLIRRADWVIDLGPEGGAGGGRVVAEGTPGEIAACDRSYTGAALA